MAVSLQAKNEGVGVGSGSACLISAMIGNFGLMPVGKWTDEEEFFMAMTFA